MPGPSLLPGHEPLPPAQLPPPAWARWWGNGYSIIEGNREIKSILVPQ